jgi:hypothetical protein
VGVQEFEDFEVEVMPTFEYSSSELVNENYDITLGDTAAEQALEK